MIIEPYPHVDVQVIDSSIREVPSISESVLYQPVFVIQAEKGPIGVPTYITDGNQANTIFGDGTFDPLNKKYFNKASRFALGVLSSSSGVWLIRVATATAEASSAVLEAVVEDSSTIPVYSKLPADAQGVIRRDSDTGDVQDGITIKYRLSADTSITSPSGSTGAVGGRVIPLIKFTSTSPGVWGDRLAFSLEYNRALNTLDAVERNDSVFVTLTPTIRQSGGGGTQIPLRDNFSSTSTAGVLQSNLFDERTNAPISLESLLSNNYTDGRALPYEVEILEDNISELNTLVFNTEVTRPSQNPSGETTTEPGAGFGSANQVNPFSAIDENGIEYDRVIVEAYTGAETPVTLTATSNNFLSGGNDGDVSDEVLDNLTQLTFENNLIPNLEDSARYPFTHIFDVGYSLDTKEAMIDFTSIREDVKAVISTQVLLEHEDSSGNVVTFNGFDSLNDQATDLATGNSLVNRALLQRESIQFGTRTVRVSVFAQSGELIDGSDIVPATYWYATGLAGVQNTQVLSGSLEGRPNSNVNIFRRWNWTPSSERVKSVLWDSAINTFIHADNREVFYSALRSVYNGGPTSVLESDNMSNVIVYIKHLARRIWSDFVGRQQPQSAFELELTAAYNDRLGTLLNQNFTFNVTVSQTAVTEALGYATNIRIDLFAGSQHRVQIIELNIDRAS